MKLTGALVVFMVLLAPGAPAVEYSYSFGDGASETSGGYNIGGAATINLVGNAKDISAHNAFFARGPISTSRSANSGNGLAHATSTFSVTGSNAKTMYDFTSSAGTYYAQTTESLTSFDADTISARGYSSTNNGDYAESSILVTSPTDDKAILMGYYNKAYAYQYGTSSSYAQANQGCTWADVSDYTNGRIFTRLYAKEGGGDWSQVSLNMPWGTINNPYPSSPYNNAIAYASRTANSGLGRTYAYQSTNAYARDFSSPVGYYFAQSTAKIVGSNQKQANSYYTSGTHTTSQYAWTTYPNYNVVNTHNV